MTRYHLAPLFLYHYFNLRRNVKKRSVEIEALQVRKLRRMTKYAYENVPFYYRVFRNNKIRPSDIRSRKDTAKIPISGRKDVQNNLHRMISRKVNPRNNILLKTSGSTGIPVSLYVEKNIRLFRQALNIRHFFE